MIKSKEDYKFYLEADRIALRKPRHITFQKVIKEKFITPDYIQQFQMLLRKIEYLKNCKPGILWQVRYALALRKFQRLSILLSLEIKPNVFGPGLNIAHIGTITVHAKASIGTNCRIHPCVVIGTQAGYSDRVPRIGDNVFIGPGAKIFGQIEIADNIAIGANSVVDKSFTEPGITIAGIPARKISDKGSSGLLTKGTELVNMQQKYESSEDPED